MVLMTQDHTRDFFSNAHFSPTHLDKTSLALFLTRWITHFCAPVFVVLAGTSTYLWQQRHGDQSSVTGFLLQRGALLIVLVGSVEAWAWNFRYDFTDIHVGVLWAIGWSMIFLAGLIRLPVKAVTLTGILMMVLHNLSDGITPADFGKLGFLWSILHTGDPVTLADGWVLNPYYPLIPWLGVIAVGYGFGQLISNHDFIKPQALIMLGLLLSLLFIGLRYSNWYGDPTIWRIYPDPLFTLMSFLNCHKYPPSLLYLLMTLGPALIGLGVLQGFPANRFAVLQLFGRTPLFFYLLHLYVIHLLAILVAAINDGPVSILLGGGIWLANLPADYGFSLPWVYGFWLIVLTVMYPLCIGFERLKMSKAHWRWLRLF